METAPHSGYNELSTEELVTWKVAGRVNDISYITLGEKRGERGSRNRLQRTDIEIKMKREERPAHCSACLPSFDNTLMNISPSALFQLLFEIEIQPFSLVLSLISGKMWGV